MLTNHTVKIIQSLDKKKFRQKYNLFLVEGNKIINELHDSAYKVEEIFSLNPEEIKNKDVKITRITPQELKKISFLQNPKDSVALCRLEDIVPNSLGGKKLVLDGLQDPGNLGTMIRLADWFGLDEVICSKETVDLYGPKVVQATMGSFLRVGVRYCDIEQYLKQSKIPVLVADMQGESIYTHDFPSEFCLVMGNEGNGISDAVANLATHVVTIPRFGQKKATESLNVAVAAGIILGQAFSK